MRKVKSPELSQALHNNQGELSNLDLIKFALTGMVLLLAAMSLGVYLTLST